MIYWPPVLPYWALTANVGFPPADAVQPPTPQQFGARYPAFAQIDSTVLTAVLAEAANEVDSSWRQADQVPAIMAFAAHLIVTQGLANGTVDMGLGSLTVSGPLSSYQAGDTKISFASSVAAIAASGADGDLARTAFGLRFLELRDRNRVPTALVV